MSTSDGARRRRLYLDTSAYLSILLADDAAKRIANDTEGAELLSSVLLILETRRNLIRLTRARTITSEQYQTCIERVERDSRVFVLRDLTLDLCQLHQMPAVATPRSLDLAHLRTALWFHGETPIDRFVTLDGSQAHAARELGLPV